MHKDFTELVDLLCKDVVGIHLGMQDNMHF